MKRFACIWLPTFQIDRMRRACPGWVPQDQPFALVESGPRGIAITAVNQQAATGGIHAGQMLADARAVLPALLTRAGEPERDVHTLNQLALWLGRYGPHRNVDGGDGLWVDISGVAHLFGGEAALAHDCISRFQRAGYQALIAIADTRSGAYALARYGRMTDQIAIAAPGEIRSALAGLPVEGLQLSGDLVVLLRRLGLKRIGQFYTLPRAALVRRFREAAPKNSRGRKARRGLGNVKKPTAIYNGWAEALVMRLDQALGDLSEPARGIAEPPVYRVQCAYAEPLISHQGILAALDDLSERLCATLDERDEGARALKFAVYRADGTVSEIVVRTSRPARDVGHIAELFHARLEQLDAGLGLDAVVLEALQTELRAREQTGFAGAGQPGNGGDHDDSMGVLIDRLSNRLGPAAVFYLEEVASHIPERAEGRTAALLGSPYAATSMRESSQSSFKHGPQSGPNSHLAYVRRPADFPELDKATTPGSACEPARCAAPCWKHVANMTEAQPDLGRAVRAVSEKNLRPAFLLDPAEAITVIAEVPDGPPVRFTWRRVTRRVARAEGPERIAPEWWRLIGHIARVHDEVPANTRAGLAGGGAPEYADSTLVTMKPAWRIRDYYRVEDEHGGIYWLYRAGLYPGMDGSPDSGMGNDTSINSDGARAAASGAATSPPAWYLQGVF